MFDTLTGRFESVFDSLRGKGRLSEKDIDVALREVRLALLEADVNVTVVKTFLARVKERAQAEDVSKSLTPGQQVIKIVHEELVVTLGSKTAGLAKASLPMVILMVGLQGSGKTTTAGKLAKHLQSQGKRPLLVAADLQRPAAIDQLETLARRIDVPVYVDRKGKAPRVVKAALKDASKAGRDTIIVDTAGRLQIDDALMKELADVKKISEPDEVLLVVDAMTGQDAVNVATGFQEQVGLTGVVLSKLDGDARGGAAISVREVTGAPVKFAGVGEGLDDLEPFHPDRMASRILGMGDVLTLIEKAESAFDEAQADKTARKLEKGEFTLEDFLEQFQQMKSMGPIQDILAMLPGSGSLLRNVEVSDRDIKKVEAIIRSMTPEERRKPKIIGGSRKRRVASGSGTTPQDVNRLLKQFADSQKMMKQLAGGKGTPSLESLMGGQRNKR
jgi:signal recognition particle subunit SRP54